MKTLKKFGVWLFGILARVVAEVFRIGIVPKVIAVLATLGVAWFVTPAEYRPALRERDYSREFRQLHDGINQMQALYLAEATDFARFVDSVKRADAERDAAYWRVIDSLTERHARVVSVISGKGTVVIADEGETNIDGWYEDEWLTAIVEPDTVFRIYNLSYEMKMGVEDITTTLLDKDGKLFDVYQVRLRSLRDASKTMSLPDYRKERVAVIAPEEDRRRWLWNDWAVSLDKLFLGDSREAALVLTPFSYSTGGPALQNIVARFPSVGIAADLECLHVVVGVRANLSHVIPFVRDAYLSAHYAFGPSSGLRIGIGSTL
jgi:hypothetical protein